VVYLVAVVEVLEAQVLQQQLVLMVVEEQEFV
jgi:hypothetical protein